MKAVMTYCATHGQKTSQHDKEPVEPVLAPLDQCPHAVCLMVIYPTVRRQRNRDASKAKASS